MSTPRNAGYTKEYNQKLFLRLLHREPLSRAEIARRTGLTRASTSLIADELLSEGLITESELSSTSKSGRPPMTLKIADDACYAVGVFLNRDGCSAGIVSLSGEVICKARFKLSQEKEKLSCLCESLQKLIDASRVNKNKIVGVGISAPGPLDVSIGKILNPPRFSLWHNTEIASAVSSALNLPVYLENDASSLARYHIGKSESHESNNFLLLLVDSGVGSGIVLNGKPFSGKNSFTGELGHTCIMLDGKKCACGNKGCLEAYAAIPNLLENTSFSTWEDVMNERHINEEARTLFEKEINYLSAGIINLANILGIDTVLLAGDIKYDGSFLAEKLEQAVNSRVMHHSVRIYTQGTDANIKQLSSAEIVFDKFLSV